MDGFSLSDEVNQAVEALVARPGSKPAESADPDARDLVDIASDLRLLPNPAFRAQLKADLLDEALIQTGGATLAAAHVIEFTNPLDQQANPRDILPSLFGAGNAYPIRSSNFVLSFFGQSAALALLVALSVVVASRPQPVKELVNTVLVATDDVVLPAARTISGGGGGGGDRDKFQASKGAAPKFAAEQITPPAVVVRNEKPKLTAEPTLVGPPQITLPQMAQAGDPLSKIMAPLSNGTGYGGGIGTGSGGGVGSGRGPGYGPGEGGGIGGGVYRIGGGVSAPRAIYDPEPEYSEEARKAKHQGIVLLYVIVDPDGHPRDLRIERSLGMGLDEKAMEAVKKWRFAPAMKDGRPVSVAVNIEVNFRLY